MAVERIMMEIAVDVGSTNSQVAVQLRDMDTNKVISGDGDLKKSLLREEGKPAIRTTILRKDDVDPVQWDNITWTSDVYCGRMAWDTVSQHFKGYAKLTSGFKQRLYYSPEDRKNPQKEKEYQKACEDMVTFLRFLKEKVDDEYQRYSNEIVKRITYITVPNRSGTVEQETMKRLAEQAGWENVEIRLEAQSALRYTLARQNSPLMAAVENIRVFDVLYVILADIGGSTADILLVKIQPDGKGSYTSDTLGWWPDRGEHNTLGGVEVDRAIRCYMERKGYIVPRAAEDEVAMQGYEKFRLFKEFYTLALRKGKTIQYLGELEDLQQYPTRTRRPQEWSQEEYDRIPENQKINKDIYLKEIANDYLSKLRDAVRSLIENSRDGETAIKEEDIDFVVVTGGGSNMVGMEELFCGEFPVEDPLKFDKIRADRKRYISEESEYASAVCAMGCLAELRRIQCREHSNGTYTLSVALYKAAAGDAVGWDNKNGIPDIPKTFTHLCKEIETVLFREGDMLPEQCEVKRYYNVVISNKDNLILIMKLIREKNGKRTTEREWSTRTARGLFHTIGAKFKEKQDLVQVDCTFDCRMTEQQRIIIKSDLKAVGGSRGGMFNYEQDIHQ